ncbi:hypothetical protein DESAMIL20_89 [Desulfurella amilsii]|uniref:Uncharacterized protein n=1 Tax=Desulfurella amilsii TaxID=1562698 RepID=A0A1X4XZK8_9BACT|nr:hypothetical protein DESAMIL20_89 [Desulfurella amilsii]
MRPFFVLSLGIAQATAAEIFWPSFLETIDAYATGTNDPSGNLMLSWYSQFGGKIELILTRFVLPMPLSSKATSNALSNVNPSALDDESL